ncbi:hypothetical protein L1887_59115 [Cichorium endivia]|nr:hypothetical protein L1887_59115 [Cichorium endivia]
MSTPIVYYAESISYAGAIPDVVVPSDGPHLFLLLNVEIMGRALVDDRAGTSDPRQRTTEHLYPPQTCALTSTKTMQSVEQVIGSRIRSTPIVDYRSST